MWCHKESQKEENMEETKRKKRVNCLQGYDQVQFVATRSRI